MRTDFENLEDGDRVVLHPNESNPLHNSPVKATYVSGYFYCDETNPEKGPDYYFGDAFKYNSGFVAAD